MKNRGEGGRSLLLSPSSHAPRSPERQLCPIPRVRRDESPDWRPLPPSYAPRNASIPCGLNRLRILPVTTGVCPFTRLGSGFLWRRLLWRGSRRLLGAGFSAGPAQQRQGILGIERELPGGLFSRRAQDDVHAPVVGHAYGQQISQDFLFLHCGQVGIGFDQLRDLLSAHGLLKAVGPHFQVSPGNALLHQVTSGALHAALRELVVVFLGAANV